MTHFNTGRREIHTLNITELTRVCLCVCVGTAVWQPVYAYVYNGDGVVCGWVGQLRLILIL